MKKTTNDELNQWHFQYPSTTVSWNFTGDPAYCQQFVGEAKNMLYQLKNRMNIAVPKLKSLQDIRHYDGGTVITVRSIFGQDFIEIMAGRAGFPSCLIKLFDLPLVIPPMKWYAPGLETWEKVGGAWIIKNPNGVVEVEGVDYIKTYFSWVTRDCPACAPVEFTVAKGDDANILTGSSPNRPFWYKSEDDEGELIYNYEGEMVPHFMGYDWTTPPVPENPLNHTIYSFWGCQAQIMKNGKKWSFSDAGGSYFLWKAYTEWSNVGPQVVDFTRTGLGYMLMKGFIKNQGVNLCESVGNIIKVDCCLKPVGDRQVILYWESLSGYEAGGPTCIDQPFMFYGSMKICEVPSVIGPLWAKLCTPRNSKAFYVIPEISGGCIPFTWELVGGAGWTLTPSQPFGETASLAYECSLGAPTCNESVDVTVTDRCGTTDTVHSQSCCESNPSPVSIGYTSLLMSCGAQQTFTANGGCGPYSWAVTGGGGTITQGGVYTAPATNPNCISNPTITLTDCCGATAQLQLTVNCYTPSATALCQCTVDCLGTIDCIPWGDYYHCRATLSWAQRTWDCNGNLLSEFLYSQYGWWDSCVNADCSMGCTNTSSCTCENLEAYYGQVGWSTAGFGCGSEPKCDGSLKDLRTALMKENGCCPINPLTGLPY